MNRPYLVILAGGKGTRLGKLTEKTPKPMIPIAGKPFLAHLVDEYSRQGFKNIIISTGYRSEQIHNYKFSCDVHFEEDSPYTIRGMGIDMHEAKLEMVSKLLYLYGPCWIVNGDTWLKSPLPEVTEGYNIVMVANNKDAGAQYLGNGRDSMIMVVESKGFIDMGTPEGLKEMEDYFANRKNTP